MTGIVYIATSLDGFIARKDGGLDWLAAPDSETQGNETESNSSFDTFLESIDALVMGRNTYDMVQSFGVWGYGDKPVFVLTHRLIVPPEDSAACVEAISGAPEKVVAELASRNLNNLYIDGGETVQAFLRSGQIHRLIITRIPVLLGDGIPLFGELEADVKLRCIRAELLTNGLEQAEYEVLG
jgi:dihydrofolate reductase